MVIMSQPVHLIPFKSETPFTGLEVDWYHHGDVIVYKLTHASDDTLRRWAEFTLQTVENWSRHKPYLAVHDLSHVGVSLPYAVLTNFDMMNIGIVPDKRVVAEHYFYESPRWSARIAVNFNLTLSGQTNRTLMNLLGHLHPSIQYKTFYNRAKCVNWLTTGISDTGEMNVVHNDD